MSALAEIMDSAPSVTVKGTTATHNARQWRVATNRHPTLYGASWGWIEGAPGNVCWSNDESFNREAAEQMVAAHADWLEEQKPLSIRMVEARDRYAKARADHDVAAASHSKAHALLVGAEESLSALAAIAKATEVSP